MKFFIFSLPRSGSAWLSVFLTGPQSFCFHEPTAECIDVLDLFETRSERIVGGVDTKAYQYAQAIHDTLHGCRFFVLTRDIGEVQKSVDKLVSGYDVQVEFMKFAQATAGLTQISHDRLRDVDYLKRIWLEVIGTSFDAQRARLLTEMNIQRDIDRFRKSHP